MTNKKEIVLIEIPDMHFGAVTFVTRWIGFPNASNQRIQQKAWGVPPYSCGDPQIFPIYGAEIGWDNRTNERLVGIAYGRRLEDYALTFDEAVQKAYRIAKKWADPCEREGATLIEYTRYNGQIPLQTNKDHWFWFQE